MHINKHLSDAEFEVVRVYIIAKNLWDYEKKIAIFRYMWAQNAMGLCLCSRLIVTVTYYILVIVYKWSLGTNKVY